jgi:hypothetical protein
MEFSYSHKSTKKHTIDDVVTIHYENIMKNFCGSVEMKYEHSGTRDRGTVVVRKKGKDVYYIENNYDRDVPHNIDPEEYSHRDIVKILKKHPAREHLEFMINYLESYDD